MDFKKVSLSDLGPTMRDVAEIFEIGQPGKVIVDGKVNIAADFHGNPKYVRAIYDTDGRRITGDTPLPFQLASDSGSR
jgi:hypothetical protein